MFSFIVSGNATSWETDQLMRMDSDRFKEDSLGPEAQAVNLADPESLRLLEQAPALLMYEVVHDSPDAEVVRYGRLRDIHVMPRELTFRFSEEGRYTRAVVREFADRLGIRSFEFGRTHWAIKEAGLPRDMRDRLLPTYDVVLSFAGEDRAYVEAVATILREHHATVFYDAFETIALWGRDLSEHLDTIYRRSGRYCVFFISAHYARSMWTRHERRSAFARALQSRGAYILPARFDDTDLEGLQPTIGYVTLHDKTPKAFAGLLLRRIGE